MSVAAEDEAVRKWHGWKSADDELFGRNTEVAFRDPDECTAAINRRLMELLRRNENGDFVPHSCLVCDSLMVPEDICYIGEELLKKCVKLLSPSKDGWNSVGNSDLESYYKYNSKALGYRKWMKTMLLSPRGSCKQETEGRKEEN